MNVPLLDLKKQYDKIRQEIMLVTEEIFESQQFILGRRVEAFEEKIAGYCKCNYAVGVSSGTDALLISLMAAGVGLGDLVITTPYTFFATVGAISRVGAKPIFVDIDEQTYNMDLMQLDSVIASIDKQQKERIKAIIPVHLFGQCVDMESVRKVAERHGLVIIEDAAQAIGAEYEFSDGTVKRAGSMGQYGCFSFFPSKNLGAFGDAGLVTTNEEEVFKRLATLRVHGAESKYYHSIIGGNFRLDALQAAVLTVKLQYLDEWTERRKENADLYRRLFQERALGHISLPIEKQKRHIYNQFVIKVKERRNELRQYLIDHGVGCAIYYPVPLHIQDCFKDLGYRPEDFPVSLAASEQTLALPIFPELTYAQIEYVVGTVVKFFKF